MNSRHPLLTATIAPLGLLTTVTLSWAQAFPERPVTMVIPVAAGSGSDVLGRFIADALSEDWGQPVVVENLPGAGTVIGSERVAHSEPDGYTILFNSNNYTIQAAVAPDLPFDPINDLVPIALAAHSDMVLVAGSRTPLASLEDVITTAQQQRLYYGATGTSSTGAFLIGMLNDAAGVDIEVVNYSGAPEASADLAGGRLDLYGGSLATLLPIIESGGATPVAVASPERSAFAPDVPTTAEAGYPTVLMQPWYGFFVPAGTPDGIIDKINADITAALETPEADAFMENVQARVATMSPDEFTDYVHADIDEMRRVAELAGMIE